MKPAKVLTSSAIGLPPEQFATTFPFHMAVDRSLKVVQTGSTLQRVCPDVAPGALLSELFKAIQPEITISFESLLQNHRSFFLLEHQATQLQLRGEFVLLPGEDTLLFLGSPWFTDASEIASRRLGFEDFAIHDPVVDMLQVYQASKLALGDAKKLAGKLTAQRAELRAANERLRQQEIDTRKLALVAARTDNGVTITIHVRRSSR
jgi:two-component system, sensor histidine kinase and response regulator